MNDDNNFKVIEGTLGLYAETGSEGYCWVIVDSDPASPPAHLEDVFYILKKGDLLTVFNRGSDTTMWQGTVDLDYSINTDDRGDQWVMGYNVAGLQKNVPPDQWADMFMNFLPATLVRRTPAPS